MIQDETSEAEWRARAEAFLESPAFERYYRRAHMARWAWTAGQLIRTIAGSDGAFQSLLDTRYQACASRGLRARYRRLAEGALIVRGFVLLSNEVLIRDPFAIAPALVVASLAGTPAGDAFAEEIRDRILDRVRLQEPSTPAEREVARMLEDERYRAFRKQELPREFTEGLSVHLLQLKIDNRLLADGGLASFKDHRIRLLVDPAPDGPILAIPSVDWTAIDWDLQPAPPAERVTPCPSCGFFVFVEDRYGSFDICELCGWEDCAVQLGNPLDGCGPNRECLVEYQQQSIARWPLRITRVQHGGRRYERDRTWRPLSAPEIEHARHLVDKFGALPSDAVWSIADCYWRKTQS
jgi:hypothetical protein